MHSTLQPWKRLKIQTKKNPQRQKKVINYRGPLNRINMNKRSTSCMVLVNWLFFFPSNWKHLSCTGFQRGAPQALPFKHQTKTRRDVVGEAEHWQTKLEVFHKQKCIWPKMACSAPYNRPREEVITFCCRGCLYIVWPRVHESCYLYLQSQIQEQSSADCSGSDT